MMPLTRLCALFLVTVPFVLVAIPSASASCTEQIICSDTSGSCSETYVQDPDGTIHAGIARCQFPNSPPCEMIFVGGLHSACIALPPL
jgi:hypothetical protein